MIVTDFRFEAAQDCRQVCSYLQHTRRKHPAASRLKWQVVYGMCVAGKNRLACSLQQVHTCLKQQVVVVGCLAGEDFLEAVGDCRQVFPHL